MRTRTRTILSSSSPVGPFNTHREYSDGRPDDMFLTLGTGLEPCLMDYEEEYITDDPSSGRQFKECEHVHRKFSRTEFTSIWDTPSTDLAARYHASGPNAFVWSWGRSGEITPANILVSYPIELQLQLNKCIHDFYSINEVDNLTNIVESPQLISGLQSIRKNLLRGLPQITMRRSATFIRLGNLMLGLPKLRVTSKGNLRSLGNVVSSAWLYNAFGVQPLLNDMRKIHSSVGKIHSQLKRHQAHVGKHINVHNVCHGKYTLINMGSGYGDTASVPGTHWHVTRNGDAPKRIVTVRGVRNNRYRSEIFADLDFRMRKFLSGGPASFLWERIPYSFVIDWFVDLSGIVDSLDRFLTGDESVIQEACYSTSYRLGLNAVKHPYLPNWPHSSHDGVTTATNSISYYHRKPIAPTYQVTSSGRFGKRQLAHTSALLYQIVANLKRVR